MQDAASPEKPLKKLDARNLSFGRLFDEVPCYISIQGSDLRVLEANRKLIEDFGDPISKKCYEVYKGRADPCPECPVVKTFSDDKEHTSEEIIFDQRGLPHDVVVNTKSVHDRDGNVIAVMELFTDITVRKELERRLHDSLSRFQNLFDNVPCYISVQDREFTVIEANQLFKDSFGALHGSRCYEIYKKRAERCEDCPVAETYADGEVHHSEQVVIDKNGKHLHVVVYTAPIRNAQGRITSVMEVSADLTELKALQDKLAFIGQLVAGTAHGVKNVLEGLRGGVYIVNLGFQNDSKDDIKTGWEMVERNVRRISSMVMDMLYCAKERSPRRLPVSLPSAIQEVIDLYKKRASDVGVRLEADIDGGIEAISAEPKDIHALVSNLITNAIDACSSAQNEEKDYRVIIRLSSSPNEAVIEIEDNGIGMDEETRSKLFTMFFSTKGAFGTGLGLLVSHKVVTEHGGSIAVDSEPEKGSTFTVRLPLVHDEQLAELSK